MSFDYTPLPGGRRIATNGIEMYAVEVGRGAPLVFLHGLGWSHLLWRSQIERYRDRYRVIAADSRGHGLSTQAPGPYSIDLYAVDWRGLLDALGLDGVCLIGFSQGGMTAMRLAIALDMRVKGLVLAGTACRIHPGARQNMERRIAAARTAGAEASARIAAEAVFSARFADEHPEEIEAFVAWRAAAPEAPLEAAMRAAYDFDCCDGLRGLDYPVLVVHGAEDRLTSVDNARRIVQHLPRARLEIVEQSGHMVPVEQPETFGRLLDGYLDEIDC